MNGLAPGWWTVCWLFLLLSWKDWSVNDYSSASYLILCLFTVYIHPVCPDVSFWHCAWLCADQGRAASQWNWCLPSKGVWWRCRGQVDQWQNQGKFTWLESPKHCYFAGLNTSLSSLCPQMFAVVRSWKHKRLIVNLFKQKEATAAWPEKKSLGKWLT